MRPGSLICIVGAPGSGKSALLSAVAGDIIKSDGKLQINVTSVSIYIEETVTAFVVGIICYRFSVDTLLIFTSISTINISFRAL